MIKKDSRPIKRWCKGVIYEEGATIPKQLYFNLLKYSVHHLFSGGRVVLSYKYMFYPLLEDYDGQGYRVIVNNVYVGKRKCKDANLRRLLRQSKIDKHSIPL